MRIFLLVTLGICALIGGVFALTGLTDARSIAHEIQGLIGILVVAVCAGAVLVAGWDVKKP